MVFKVNIDYKIDDMTYKNYWKNNNIKDCSSEFKKLKVCLEMKFN